ncbi:indole-3-glycerol phosphate synthase TrpC [Catalinimonas sp. 4WD22]|uniref:indole-3-glycerol phosphate synthase TrpC n=1 Tax=Catalinimonas locisalis TaxID=3133978 RepID=UPI00310150BE
MNILDKIVVRKKEEIAQRKAEKTEASLQKSPLFERQTFSLSQELRKKQPAIIAEFKRKSPSKGVINAEADVMQTTTGYVQAGAAALSVLTDIDFFNGSDENLKIARQHNDCPILRKDFTIDPYQITEAKAIGADAILLIAAILSPEEVRQLASFARELGLEVLLEVHNAEELQQTALNDTIAPFLNIVGVNNRNLKTFEVSIQTSIDLAEMMPKETVKISESGISNVENIRILTEHGYQGFLIGEYFMKQNDPAAACKALIQQI